MSDAVGVPSLLGGVPLPAAGAVCVFQRDHVGHIQPFGVRRGAAYDVGRVPDAGDDLAVAVVRVGEVASAVFVSYQDFLAGSRGSLRPSSVQWGHSSGLNGATSAPGRCRGSTGVGHTTGMAVGSGVAVGGTSGAALASSTGLGVGVSFSANRLSSGVEYQSAQIWAVSRAD